MPHTTTCTMSLDESENDPNQKCFLGDVEPALLVIMPGYVWADMGSPRKLVVQMSGPSKHDGDGDGDAKGPVF